MNMKRYRLGEICEIVSGSTPKTSIQEYWDGDIKWITPAEITDDSYIITDTVRKITKLGVEKNGLSSFPAGTVILSSRAPIGKVAIAGCDMYCNQGFKNLICSKIINNKYLYWFLKGKKDYLNKLGRGATFKEISKQIVAEIEIELPSLEEQVLVANNLLNIKRVIDLKKKEIDLFDKLIKARFVEMFGDPIRNSKNLPTDKISERYFLKAGITTSADEIHDYSEVYKTPCFGGNGVRGYVKSSTYSGEYPIIGRQGALCGNIQFATGNFHATEHAVLVTILQNDNVLWVYYLLKFMDLNRFHTGAAQPGLSVKTLNTVDIITVDRKQQDEFASFAKQVDKSKVEVQRSLEKTQMLFDSLMQQYFG